MPLNLEEVDRTLLARAPLASVICQVRFEASPKAAEARTITALRDRLGGEPAFPRIEEIRQGLSFSFGPGMAQPQPQQAQGWRIQSESGSRVVALFPTAVTWETFEYRGWEEDFAPTLAHVLEAVEEIVEPVFEQRLGLRYINQVKIPEDAREPQVWTGLIDPAFLSLAAHEEIGPHVSVSRQQTALELEDGVKCVVNQGFGPDDERGGALTYVLDFDVYREGLREFDTTDIAEEAARFNLTALRLFQLATTSELREMLAS